MEGVAEDFDDERFGAGEGDFGAVLFAISIAFSDGALAGVRVGEDVALDEQPLRVFDAFLIDVRAARWLDTARQVRMVRSASGVISATQVPVASPTMTGLPMSMASSSNSSA